MDASPAAPRPPAFYFDLGSPDCYLVAERILSDLPVLAEWQPVHAPQLGAVVAAPDPDALRRRVAQRGLQPLRLPPIWPPQTELAMRAATYARAGGRTVAFCLAAFRQAFAGGRDLGEEATVLIAAAACEMHPRAVLAGVATRATVAALRAAGDRAAAAGVRELPAIDIGGRVFQGPDALELAVAALSAPAPPRPHVA